MHESGCECTECVMYETEEGRVKEPSPMPDAVIDAILTSYTTQRGCPCWDDVPDHPRCPVTLYDSARAHQILREIRWYGLEGCYGFKIGTMFVGVELDGYMHT